ncbi:hypothetical protein C0992_007878 [Termitomyces sp. T32_za158]|nr:hypothetical protein C0992_007878 [Termitomyces sp. T32_za158]
MVGMSGRKHPIVLDSDGESEDDTPVKKARISLGNPTAMDDNGYLVDINVQSIVEEQELREDKRRDIDWFFHQPIMKEINGRQKNFIILLIFHMIDVASHASEGVKIPGRKSMRAAIKQTFRIHLKNLKAELNGSKVPGKVNLTCDAWQAGNIDGYFTVTGHWIEEIGPMLWELKTALIGFTRLCNAHNGERLGQALFKLVDQIGIAHKIGLGLVT